jgi:PPP family 3-phenylpropionic acid transporter
MTTVAAPPVTRRQLVPFAALSASYFAHIGFLNPYLPLWLKDLGLSLWMIGLLTSMQAVTRVFAPYIWGSISDRKGMRVPLLRWCSSVALLFSLGLILEPSPWFLASILFGMFIHTSSMMPMSEAAMSHLVSQAGVLDIRRYGLVRLWGSVGFLVTVFLSGSWFESRGIGSFPYWAIGTLAMVNLSCWFLPQDREVSAPSSGDPHFWQVFIQKKSRWFFMTLFFHVLSHIAVYSFFSLYLDELGYGKDMIGVLWAVSVLVEILGFFTQSWWLHLLRLPTWLVVCSGAMLIRMAMTAWFAPTLWLLLVAQCLHVLTFSVHHTASIAWLSQQFPGRLRGRGQALFAVIGYGMTGVIGSMGGVAISSHWGLHEVFVASALVTVIAIWSGHRLGRVS